MHRVRPQASVRGTETGQSMSHPLKRINQQWPTGRMPSQHHAAQVGVKRQSGTSGNKPYCSGSTWGGSARLATLVMHLEWPACATGTEHKVGNQEDTSTHT